jgi:hypothetical protein
MDMARQGSHLRHGALLTTRGQPNMMIIYIELRLAGQIHLHAFTGTILDPVLCELKKK